MQAPKLAIRKSFSFLIVAISICGCATTGKNSSGAVYRESATDVTDRAPASMALPNGGKLPAGDAVSQRTQADYHFALAETYGLQGDAVRAIEEYKLTLVYDPKSPTVRVRMAAEYMKQGLISEALEQAKAAIQLDPNYVDARLLVGGLYSALRTYDDALREYRTVAQQNPDNLEAPLYVGAILAEQKKYAEASEQFEKLAKTPGNANAHVAWYYLGRVYLEQDRQKHAAKAEQAFASSVAARAGYIDGTLALGNLYENSSRKERAQRLYQTYQEKFGPNASIAEELSRIYIENKDYTRAFDQLAIMENQDPQDVGVKAKMAFILIEQQRYPEAITRLEGVLAIEPNSDKIRFYLGAVHEELKDYKSAVTHFAKVPLGSSYFTESVVHTAYLYKLMSDYDRAIAAIQAGIKQKDDHTPFYALYASLLDDTKQFDAAVKMLSAAVKKVSDPVQLYFFLGNMQDRTGDKPGTLVSMNKVLELDKDHVQALNFLAYTYAENGHKLDEAEKLARRAFDLQPDDGYVMDTLGWVVFKRGRTAEAIRLLEAAYKLVPGESVIAEHLGDAYYQSQMPEKAKKLYMRAAETESNVATLEKIRGKITSVDRQIQVLGSPVESSRQPASTKSR